MNKKVIKPLVLVLVFIGALFSFSILTNKVNKDLTTTMDEASLPVVQFVYQNMEMNELHGYAQEMDMLSMRDGVLPLDENRALCLEVMTYGNQVDALSYKVRSMDEGRLLAEKQNVDITASKEKIECNITLPMILEANVEYNLEIILTVEDRNIYYYTRILQPTDCYVKECLNFAWTFHDYTFREDAVDFIPTYMDPATGDATTLNYVDLTCTLKQITWADFTGEKLTEPIVSFKEINDSYNVLVFNYVMTNINESNEVEYYNVEEYYRLRQTPTRMYVLNFERTMNQIFQQENDFILGNSSLLLGIRDKNVEYLANESGDCIAFVQEGDLWCYDRVNNTISRVFSFRGAEGINTRENWNEHNIRIVRVDEAGSVSFLVYGYMNRGEHEGQVGVGVYHYDGISHTLEEEIFISSNKSYEVLQAELGQLMYVNEQKILYLTLNDDIYKIDMNSFEVTLLLSSDTSDCYAVSPSGRYLAWVSPEHIYDSSSIILEDLKNGTSYQITVEEGTFVKPVAFIGEDFVYGVANASDVHVDEVTGQQIFLMNKIEIMNTSEDKQDVIKTYHPDGGYIGSATVDEKNIYLVLVNEQSVQIGSDTIMNRESAVVNGVTLKKSVTDIKQTQMILTMKELKNSGGIKVITPKHILLEEDRNISIEQEPKSYYYVYVKGDVLLATQNPSEAIRMANARNGVVVDSHMKYIFKRARNNSQTAFSGLEVNEADKKASSIIKCISAMLMHEEVGVSVSELMSADETPIDILQHTLETATVLELKNCAIDDLLYFIDQGSPVLAKTGKQQAVLLVGYNSAYVYYYDTETGKTKGVSYEQIEDMVFNGGNYFITYVK